MQISPFLTATFLYLRHIVLHFRLQNARSARKLRKRTLDAKRAQKIGIKYNIKTRLSYREGLCGENAKI
ncbi:hypothetical protein Hanom_Chr01g00077071 [Helianthus anomalus]